MEVDTTEDGQLRTSSDFASGEVFPKQLGGPFGVSRGPCGAALPWARPSGCTRKCLQAEHV